MPEPAIIINGYRLTSAQSFAIRVAVSDLYMEACTDPTTLGKDDIGIGLTQAYKDRGREVLEIMARAQPEPALHPHRRRRVVKPVLAETHA